MRPNCDVSPANRVGLADRMRERLVRGRRPAVRGTAPRIVFVWGGPGSGKTTTARLFARQRWPDCDFVDLDMDDAVHFHPAGSSMFEVRDALTGRPVRGVGNAHAMNHCIQQVTAEYLDAVHAVFRERRYHQIMHHASPDLMAEAAHMGYRTALLYVSVPFELAARRARRRAATTGRFLDGDTFRRFFRTHQQLAPHYAGMCDAAYALDNSGDDAAANAARARSLPEGRARAAALRSLVREWGHALPDGDAGQSFY
jgi:dephospho-CoA kinase